MTRLLSGVDFQNVCRLIAFIKRYQCLHGLKGAVFHIQPFVVFAALHLPSRHRPVFHHGNDASVKSQIEPHPNEAIILLVHFVDNSAQASFYILVWHRISVLFHAIHGAKIRIKTELPNDVAIYYIRYTGSKCPYVEHGSPRITPKTMMNGFQISAKNPPNIRFILRNRLGFLVELKNV